jgi:hypothetical protein
MTLPARAECPAYDRVYRWRKFRPDLFGRRCRVVAHGSMNSALVEFETGERHVVSRNALRKLR